MDNTRKVRYLVDADCLSRALRLTVRTKELLATGEAATLDAALQATGISRSTFYKYKDSIYSFYDMKLNSIVNISMSLQNRTGVLSGVLNLVANCGGNVITINQGLPALTGAVVTMSVGMGGARVSVAGLVEMLQSADGVSAVRVDGLQDE